MGLFDNIFRKRKRPMACVYAGPEYFARKRGVIPEPEPINAVYAGPVAPEQDADIEDVYNGPAGPDPEEPVADESAEYPENHGEPQEPSVTPPLEQFMTAYAGPQFNTVPPMMFVYAGPVRPANSGNNGFQNMILNMQGQDGKGEMKAGETPKTLEPIPEDAWRCNMCGATNTGKFCTECGTPRLRSTPEGTYLA